MKRRFISMAICLAMLITSFTAVSCGKEDDLSDVGADAVASAMTLTIYGIKGAGTTDEAIALVEERMSSITEAQFNAAVKLMLYTEKEYDKVLEAKMDEIQEKLDLEAAEAEAKKQAEKEAKKNNNGETTKEEETSAEETTELADETILNEYGMVETFYPEVEDDQLDIFLMTDYEMFKKYNDKGVLSALDEQLNAGSKILKSYIHPTILAAGKVGKTTYAIPTNQQIGEYTYMLLNKGLMDKYYYDADNFKTLLDAEKFIEDVGENESVKPFMGDLEPLNINYFTADGSKSVIGAMEAPGTAVGGAPASLLEDPEWITYMTFVSKLKENSWVGAKEIKAGDKFGVGVIKGTPADIAAFEEDYYVVVLQNPTATTENVYNGMFGISKYTKNVERSMEILTYLNTRSDLRNLFAYGIQDVHYELDENGVVKKLSKDYNMSLEYTGNMFVAYPPEGSDPDIWEQAKTSNLDMIKSPWFGFFFNDEMVDSKVIKAVKSFSDPLVKELDSIDSVEEFESWISDNSSDVTANESVTEFLSTEAPEVEEPEEGEEPKPVILPMGKIYADWAATAGK